MKIWIDKFIVSYGLVISYTTAIMLFITFYFGYFFCDYRIIVTINEFGEAHIEALVVIPLMLVWMSYALTRAIKKELKD